MAWSSILADGAFKMIGEAETNWPGIHYQLFLMQRMEPDRLVVGVRLLAMPNAPATGTLIGWPVPIPPDAKNEAIRSGLYSPHPFSLVSSVMTDNVTKEKFPTLDPISPPGRKWFPSQVLAILKPGKTLLFTVQFKIPPPPPTPTEGQPPAKQTVSFLFTNAKSEIKNITIPPAPSSQP